MRASLLASLALAFLATGVAAQQTGTKVVTDDNGGKDEINCDTTGDLEITKVEHWDPWTEEWDEIDPECIKPNPGNDPVINLTNITAAGEKFKIHWKTTEGGEGGPFNHEPTFTLDECDCYET